MTDHLYFIPRTGEIILSDKSKHILVKGVRPVPDFIANDPAATRYGVKPVSEMSNAERVAHKLPPAAPDVDESRRVSAPEEAKTVAPVQSAVKPTVIPSPSKPTVVAPIKSGA